jgi:Spy/CpxP family protein refolding chaperone
MRTLAMAAAVLTLVALPAQAQMGGGGGKRGQKADDTAKTEDQKAKAKAADKAYQEALKRIPDSKEKFDPWAVAKPSDADKKPSK